MPSFPKLVPALALCAPLLAVPAQPRSAAQSHPASTARSSVVVGQVVDEDERPLAAAAVFVYPEAEPRSRTRDEGTFSLGRLPLGEYHVVVRRDGYVPREFRLLLREPDSVTMTVTLAAAPEDLPVQAVAQVTVDPADADVRDRAPAAAVFHRRHGGGVAFDRAAILAHRPGVVSDMLRLASGLQLSSGASVGGNAVQGRTVGAAGGCSLPFYRDGTFIGSSADADRTVDPDDVIGMEIFRGPSEIPIEYQGAETYCGLVLIYTRRGGQ